MGEKVNDLAEKIVEPYVTQIINKQLKSKALKKRKKLARLREEMKDLKDEIKKDRRLLTELEIKRLIIKSRSKSIKYQKESKNLHENLAKHLRRYAYLYGTRVPEVHEELCQVLHEDKLADTIRPLPPMDKITIDLDDNNCGINKEILDHLLQEPRSKFHQKCIYNVLLRNTLARFSFGSLFRDPAIHDGINSTEAILFEIGIFYDAACQS